jgi:hypothetical protein
MMTKEIFQQLLAVRDSGYCNMFDLKAVQQYAYDHDWYELVVYIEENQKEYTTFIMNGEAPGFDPAWKEDVGD